jgi:hypothetical protein
LFLWLFASHPCDMYICFMRSAVEIWTAADCARADVLGQVLARVLFAGAVLMKHEDCLSQVRSVCSGCSLQLQAHRCRMLAGLCVVNKVAYNMP